MPDKMDSCCSVSDDYSPFLGTNPSESTKYEYNSEYYFRPIRDEPTDEFSMNNLYSNKPNQFKNTLTGNPPSPNPVFKQTTFEYHDHNKSSDRNESNTGKRTKRASTPYHFLKNIHTTQQVDSTKNSDSSQIYNKTKPGKTRNICLTRPNFPCLDSRKISLPFRTHQFSEKKHFSNISDKSHLDGKHTRKDTKKRSCALKIVSVKNMDEFPILQRDPVHSENQIHNEKKESNSLTIPLTSLNLE
ncbi:hypothetical protein M153_3840007367 [Pseudoloma neurophilia]|uniref:Uncharacterized protein n=1 Tax=Pseudoloma neurophilia TaxID=146866 RepID=A0A0R0M5A6_9MICR|nr:hypothetical protein M153_3840007367 [Pseudoloma neurophilia]